MYIQDPDYNVILHVQKKKNESSQKSYHFLLIT